MLTLRNASSLRLILLTLVLNACAPEKSGHDLRREYVDSRFGQVHLRAVRPALNGRVESPLLALHLVPNSGQVFSAFLPLIGADRVAIAPDYPGYGMSDPIAGDQRIADYAQAMFDVIDNAGIDTPVDLLGYHTGAAVAVEMSRQRPERIGRLVLVAVPVLTQEERDAGAALPPIDFDVDGEFAKAEWQRSWRWRGPGQSVDSVLATFAEKFRPGVRARGASAVLDYDLAPALSATIQPLCIVRVRDDLWDATARARALRPDARYVELPDFGHGLFHVAPERMNDVVRDCLAD